MTQVFKIRTQMVPSFFRSGCAVLGTMILLTVNHFSSGFGIAGGPVHGAKAAGMGTTFVGIKVTPNLFLGGGV